MPRTAKRARRQVSRWAKPMDATAEYNAAGHPAPTTVAEAKRAAKAHFHATPGASGAYRQWVRKVVQKRVLLPNVTRIVKIQIHRNGDVEVHGIVRSA